MSFKAKFVHGSPLMVDHTAAADIADGDVVVAGEAIRIAHSAIAKDGLGALAAGGGVYDVVKSGTGSIEFADGAKVYWDATNKVATSEATNNKQIGVAIGAASTTDTSVRVQHRCN